MKTRLRISECTAEGYSPLSIHPGWQVAYLTTVPEHQLDDLINMEVHTQTDELFILLKGEAVLLTVDYDTQEKEFEAVAMKPFVMYDVPQGVWHNIAMAPDTLLLIVEKDYTHLHDVQYTPFDEEDKQMVCKMIQEALQQ